MNNVFNSHNNEKVINIGVNQAPISFNSQIRIPSNVISPHGFTGRNPDLTELQKLKNEDNSILVLHGIGGIGKTELARKFIQDIAAEFESHIEINMLGMNDDCLSSENSMLQIVRMFDPEFKDLNNLKSAFIQFLNQQKTILFLDNVRDREQAEPLNITNALLIVTAREHFVLQGGKSRSVEKLSEDDALELIIRIAGRENISDDEAKQLAGLADYIPMAINPLASILAEDVTETAENLIKLYSDKINLLQLRDIRHDNLTVEATFDLSYERLSDELKSKWIKLAVFPSDFDIDAALFVWDDKDDQKHLSYLVKHNLVNFDRSKSRYDLHDLIRVFVISKLSIEEINEIELRFSNFYQNKIGYANSLYLQINENHIVGLELFEQEQENIRKGWEYLSKNAIEDKKYANLCLDYLSAGGNLLLKKLPNDELIKWCNQSISFADQHEYKPAKFTPLWLLGLAHGHTGEYNLAETAFRNALCIAEEQNHTENVAHLLNYLGETLTSQGRPAEALELLRKSKQIFCDAGFHHREGTVFSNIAFAYRRLGDSNQEFYYLKLVLDNYRKENNKFEEANALGNLANHFNHKNKNLAVICSEHAADIFHKLNFFHEEAISISQAGLLQVEISNEKRGIKQIKYAIVIHQNNDDIKGEALSVGRLGEAYKKLKEYEEALNTFDRQIELAKKINDLDRQSSALGNKGVIYKENLDYDMALELLELSIDISRSTGNLRDEFISLCQIGEIHAKKENKDEAISTFEDQIKVAKKMRTIGDVIHACKHLADLFIEWGENPRAVEYMNQPVDFAKASEIKHDYPESLFELSQYLFKAGETEEAISQAEKAKQLFEDLSDENCSLLVEQSIEKWRKY